MAQQPSKACCQTPPVISKGYEPKGKYTTVDGMKTYTTGPSTASKAILFVFDIFGFWPQTIQGADILSTSDHEKPYQVFMPDWFEGNPADISWYPPDTEEKGKKLGNFFSTTGAPPKTVQRIPKVVKEIQGAHPEIKEWGIIGFCWGGKVANLCSTSGTPFKVAAQAHPAMVDPNDAPNVTIPMALLASAGEPKADVEAYKKNLKVPNLIESYPDMPHGFLAARCDLENKSQRESYEKGYQTMLNWFHDHMGGGNAKL